MALKVYNTLTRKKEVFKPIRDKKVGLYTCGPTVYDYDHLGHAWNYVASDVLRRVLEYNGYRVKHVMNITDVGHMTSDADTGEEKMELAARREKKSAWKLAEFYTKIFMKNREKLNMLKPSVVCKATDHIREMAVLINRLEKKGYTYKISDGIYFSISKYPKYGQLSGNTPAQLKAGARVEINPEKIDPIDFALWKFSPKDSKREMEWDSPWGKGFPGWHIECSAMSMKYLGEHFDIHTGGEDNIFPHHESEIAQSEAATGKKFVNYWLHTRFLLIEGQKMSKSLHNFYRVQDLEEKGFKPLALRYLFLTAKFRSPFNFTFEGLKSASVALERLKNNIAELKDDKKLNKKYLAEFEEAINDDLNTPNALAVLWNLIRDAKASGKVRTIAKMDEVFGLDLLKKEKKGKISEQIKKLIKQREQARKNKDFKTADKIRNQLAEKGIILEDLPEGGTRWKVIK
jgi:cysteinyl-tRNA synthetase